MHGRGDISEEKKMKVGDSIKCSSLEEANALAKGIEKDGFDVRIDNDFRTGKAIITITGEKSPEAVDHETKIPDMDEMIEACKKKQRPDESIVFALGVGRMCPLPFDKKAVKKGIAEGLKYIKSLDGFIGVHPLDLHRNLLFFDTLNNAKGGRNLLKSKDVAVGQIIPILIETKYIQEAKK